jgi:tetratricopeptide (TPR) repeat protein
MYGSFFKMGFEKGFCHPGPDPGSHQFRKGRKKEIMKMVTKSIFRNSCCLVVFTILFMLSVMPSSAKTVTYVKEYTYQASEMDSKLSCRTIALEQVKRLLLEELGTYLISETAVKDFELTKDQISSLTAGIVMTVILDEKWDGKTYFLKAKITTETDELIKSINNVRRDQEQTRTWEEVRKKTEKVLQEIENLKKEIGKGEVKKVSHERYAKAVNELSAMEWSKKGYALRYSSKGHILGSSAKNNQEAMKAFDKAIELDPNYASAYAGRAAIYIWWGQYSKALKESEQAIKLDPNLPWGFNLRGCAHTGLMNYQEAIQDFNKALELSPKYIWPYCNRSWTYFMLKDYQKALEDANKAIELDPEFSSAYVRRGRALTSLNNLQDAVQSFDKAIELDPTYSWSFYQRGFVFLKLGKNEQALEDLKKAASLGNNDAQSYLKKKGIPW